MSQAKIIANEAQNAHMNTMDDSLTQSRIRIADG